MDDDPLLDVLDTILRSTSVRKQIQPIVQRVRRKLAEEKDALMTWEPIPLGIFGNKLPPAIQSSWIFVLRAGADTGAERHPNSWQRMMSLAGSGDMRIAEGDSHVKSLQGYNVETDGNWQSNFLVSDPEAPLKQRWISIPQNVWHRPVISKRSDWTVVSFHTVPAEELIEERPEPGDATGRRQMKYFEKAK